MQSFEPLEQSCFGCSRVHVSYFPACERVAFYIGRGSGQMNQAEFIAHPVERFGVAQEQISVGQKIVVEVLDHAPLGGQVEIDQNVAAEDNVETLHEGHAGVVGEIQAAEGDVRADRGLDLELFSGGSEIFLAVKRSQMASAVAAIDRVLGMSQRMLIEVGSEDLDGPVLEAALRFFQQQHAEGVGFFSGGTAGAPDAQAAERKASTLASRILGMMIWRRASS